ncbi:hypothetical protein IFM89_029866 [Coptis chinensis]|uniref:Erythronate-4-phosphate dehydrogenase family protein n=1 Tax=Coptis chinensis TaxID=261450 RepID=A0A835HQF7_9MAGN|nr:hypothetical protein IFM89_029866 [Coptis chinensis]
MNYTENQPISNSSMSITIPKKPTYLLTNGPNLQPPSAWFEIRLFYVRISPCVINNVPEFLKILHLRREIGVSMEINGSKIPASDTATLTLRRDRIDKETSEVTYVSTDSIRVTGAIEFEVYENNNNDMMILCGSLERIDSSWSNGVVVVGENELGLEKDLKTGWSMDCYIASGVTTGGSAFFQPKLGVLCPSMEVYVAGCCSGVPLILTKTIQLSPRRKAVRHGGLDAIPEDEETGKENCGGSNGMIRQRKFELTWRETYSASKRFSAQGFEKEETAASYEGSMLHENGRIDLSWSNGVVISLWVLRRCVFQPMFGVSFFPIEVYVAGCCFGTPWILTKTIQLSLRQMAIMHGGLDAILEDKETREENCSSNGLIRQRKFEVSDSEVEEYDLERKVTPDYYSEDMYYTDEDGQLTWFNAGVRVGVGIGLGMCLGIGIGVGLLMRSYQATTRTFRRRFF